MSAGPPSVSYRVMAVRSRTPSAQRLAREMRGEVFYDHRPGGPPSAWRTARRAWASTPTGSHIVVVQDDAILCRDFRVQSARAIAARPEAMIAFYLGDRHAATRTYLRLSRTCSPFVELPMPHFIPTVALAMPALVAGEMVRWLDKKLPPGWAYDDEAIKLYRQHAGIEAYATLPCLADHDNRHKSAIGHGAHGHRHAICYVGDHVLPEDWWS